MGSLALAKTPELHSVAPQKLHLRTPPKDKKIFVLTFRMMGSLNAQAQATNSTVNKHGVRYMGTFLAILQHCTVT